MILAEGALLVLPRVQWTKAKVLHVELSSVEESLQKEKVQLGCILGRHASFQPCGGIDPSNLDYDYSSVDWRELDMVRAPEAILGCHA